MDTYERSVERLAGGIRRLRRRRTRSTRAASSRRSCGPGSSDEECQHRPSRHEGVRVAQRLPVRDRPHAGPAVSRGCRSRGSRADESAELWATVTDAVRAVKAAYSPGGRQRRHQPRQAGRRQHQRTPACSRRAALGRRRQLHDCDRQHAHPAGGAWPTRPPSCARRGPGSLIGAMSDTENLRDALPDDLNASEYVGPYQFPDNSRRRRPAYLYFGDRRRVPVAVAVAPRPRPCAGQSRHGVGGNPADRGRRAVVHVGLEDARRREAGARRRPGRRRVSPSGMPRRSRCGAGCAAGRRGGCWSTRPRARRGNGRWCWSTLSTATSSSTSPRTTPKTTG